MKNKILSLGFAAILTASMAGLTGCSGDRYNRSSGEYMDDKSIALRVREALGDHREYKFSDVNVAAYRRVVQLSGFAKSPEQKRKAEEIAEKVNGVKRVENNITVMN